VQGRRLPNPVFDNYRGYLVARSVSLDAEISPSPPN